MPVPYRQWDQEICLVCRYCTRKQGLRTRITERLVGFSSSARLVLRNVANSRGTLASRPSTRARFFATPTIFYNAHPASRVTRHNLCTLFFKGGDGLLFLVEKPLPEACRVPGLGFERKAARLWRPDHPGGRNDRADNLEHLRRKQGRLRILANESQSRPAGLDPDAQHMVNATDLGPRRSLNGCASKVDQLDATNFHWTLPPKGLKGTGTAGWPFLGAVARPFDAQLECLCHEPFGSAHAAPCYRILRG